MMKNQNRLSFTTQRYPWLHLVSVLTISALANTTAFADVYKTTDANGNVVYTDKPTSLADAKKLDVGSVSVIPAYQQPVREGFGGLPSESEYTPNSGSHKVDQTKASQVNVTPVNYQLKLLSPLSESTYRRNTGHVQLSAAVSPSLQPGDKLVFEVNGEPIASSSTSASYETSKLYRGQHTAGVKVISQTGDVLAQQHVTFFVHQTSKLLNQKNKGIKDDAKEKKPWWYRLRSAIL